MKQAEKKSKKYERRNDHDKKDINETHNILKVSQTPSTSLQWVATLREYFVRLCEGIKLPLFELSYHIVAKFLVMSVEEWAPELDQ